MNWQGTFHEKPNPADFEPYPCPRCGRITGSGNSFLHPSLGRSRWCKDCKILYTKDEVVHDIVEWYEREYCDGQTD